MNNSDISRIALTVRNQWETGEIDWEQLEKSYQAWVQEFGKTNHQLQLNLFGIKRIVATAKSYFPKGCCGMASCCLADLIPKSKIVHGHYKKTKRWFLFWNKTTLEPHTWVMVNDKLIDITADQFGGPKIYIGPLLSPWML